MKPVESALEPTNGYIKSFTRNPVEGWWELEVALPIAWVYDEDNADIKCEVLNKSDIGKLIKISPKNLDVVVDDLITFVEIIIETNKKIADKEKEFTSKMQEMKGMLEDQAKKFYQELDELRVNSFKQLKGETKKETRGRKKTVNTETGTDIPSTTKTDDLPE